MPTKKRLTMLHHYINPPTAKSKSPPRKKPAEPCIPTNNAETDTNEAIVNLSLTAKNQNLDIVILLKEHFAVEVIRI